MSASPARKFTTHPGATLSLFPVRSLFPSVVVTATLALPIAALAANLSGAIFTTTVDGSVVVASELIAEAIFVWNFGTDAEVVAIQSLIESFNSDDSVHVVAGTAGTPVF